MKLAIQPLVKVYKPRYEEITRPNDSNWFGALVSMGFIPRVGKTCHTGSCAIPLTDFQFDELLNDFYK